MLKHCQNRRASNRVILRIHEKETYCFRMTPFIRIKSYHPMYTNLNGGPKSALSYHILPQKKTCSKCTNLSILIHVQLNLKASDVWKLKYGANIVNFTSDFPIMNRCGHNYYLIVIDMAQFGLRQRHCAFQSCKF